MITSYLPQHKTHFGESQPSDINAINSKDIVEFRYDNKKRYVYVIDPSSDNRLHGLDLDHISRREFVMELIEPLLSDTTITSQKEIYEYIRRRPSIVKYNAYRTFLHSKISNINLIPYDINRTL